MYRGLASGDQHAAPRQGPVARGAIAACSKRPGLSPGRFTAGTAENKVYLVPQPFARRRGLRDSGDQRGSPDDASSCPTRRRSVCCRGRKHRLDVCDEYYFSQWAACQGRAGRCDGASSPRSTGGRRAMTLRRRPGVRVLVLAIDTRYGVPRRMPGFGQLPPPPPVSVFQSVTSTCPRLRLDSIARVREALSDGLTAPIGLPPRSMEGRVGARPAGVLFRPHDGWRRLKGESVSRSAVKPDMPAPRTAAKFMCAGTLEHSFSSGCHLHKSLADRSHGGERFRLCPCPTGTGGAAAGRCRPSVNNT